MESILIAFGLAMDAFAVSICVGVSLEKITPGQIFWVSFHFGFFQFMMPLLGWLLSSRFEKYIESFDHWIAFALLSFIGSKMFLEVFKKEEERLCLDRTRGVHLIMLSLATSIDALAVGIAFALLKKPVLETAVVIGLVTASLSFLGIKGGHKLGEKFGKSMQAIGGLVLVSIGLKILIEHIFSH